MTQIAVQQKVTSEATFTLLQTAFPDLSRNNIESLSQAAVYTDYPARTDVCREGETGTTSIYFG